MKPLPFHFMKVMNLFTMCRFLLPLQKLASYPNNTGIAFWSGKMIEAGDMKTTTFSVAVAKGNLTDVMSKKILFLIPFITDCEITSCNFLQVVDEYFYLIVQRNTRPNFANGCRTNNLPQAIRC
jgi:hypothetical protein